MLSSILILRGSPLDTVCRTDQGVLRYGNGTDRAECQKRSGQRLSTAGSLQTRLCKTPAGQLACPKFHELSFWLGEKPASEPTGRPHKLGEFFRWVSGGKLTHRISYCNRVKTPIHSFKGMTLHHANRVQVAQ